MFIRSNNILLKDNTFEDIQFFSLQLSLFIFIKQIKIYYKQFKSLIFFKDHLMYMLCISINVK